MTTLISWLAVDSRWPSSIYVATDSRISWGTRCIWDSGRKVFASRLYPDIFGYCGDTLLASQLIPAALQILEEPGVLSRYEAIDDRLEQYMAIFGSLAKAYPDSERRDFIALLASRAGSTEFRSYTIKYNSAGGRWTCNRNAVPSTSGVIARLGSGSDAFDQHLAQWNESDARNTSRAVFSAFCDTLTSDLDAATGGAPQIGALYRKGNGKAIATVWKSAAYLVGAKLGRSFLSNEDVDLRNELFERCSWKTYKRLKSAQVHLRRT